MSHWIKVQTKMEKIDIAAKALKNLGYDVQTKTADENLTITAVGRTEEVDIKIHEQLGIKQQKDGSLAFLGDFYYTPYNEQKMTEALQGRYCIEDAVEKLEEMGYFVDNEDDFKVNDAGQIEFTATNPHM